MRPTVMFCLAKIAALLALAAALSCSTPPNPTPSNGGSSGSAGAVAPPAPVSCAVACPHYAVVCKNGGDFCNQTCPGAAAVDLGYAACVMGATGCMNCDAQARASAAKKK